MSHPDNESDPLPELAAVAGSMSSIALFSPAFQKAAYGRNAKRDQTEVMLPNFGIWLRNQESWGAPVRSRVNFALEQERCPFACGPEQDNGHGRMPPTRHGPVVQEFAARLLRKEGQKINLERVGTDRMEPQTSVGNS